MEPKKSKNPFVNLANEAKETKKANTPQVFGKLQTKAPKPTKGFGGANMVKRTGRGG